MSPNKNVAMKQNAKVRNMTMVQSPSHIKALGPHGLGFLDSFCPCSKSPATGRCWKGMLRLYTLAIGSVSTGTALWTSFVGCKSVYVMCVCVLYHVDVLQVSVSTVHRSISTSSIKCKKMSCDWL